MKLLAIGYDTRNIYPNHHRTQLGRIPIYVFLPTAAALPVGTSGYNHGVDKPLNLRTRSVIVRSP